MKTFRIHFHGGERHSLDIRANTPAEARAIANARGYPNGMIKTIKVLRENADG